LCVCVCVCVCQVEQLKEQLGESGEKLEALAKAKSKLQVEMHEVQRVADESNATAKAHIDALEKQVCWHGGAMLCLMQWPDPTAARPRTRVSPSVK
jgi:hypothetical protein